MATKFNFIRTGQQPIVESDYEDIIRDCFAACVPEVKDRLEQFFQSNEDAVTFDFGDQVVTIERRTKRKSS